MRDDEETESYRLERGKPPRPDPRERQGRVPIAFSTGGVLSSGLDRARDDEDGVGSDGAAAEAAAIERGAARIAAERHAHDARQASEARCASDALDAHHAHHAPDANPDANAVREARHADDAGGQPRPNTRS